MKLRNGGTIVSMKTFRDQSMQISTFRDIIVFYSYFSCYWQFSRKLATTSTKEKGEKL